MDHNVVKSAGRVFEVLELFNSQRQAMTATNIARGLKYPASSTVALLKSMVNLGYLAYDANERSYFPTLQLALISRWLEDSYYVEGHLLELIDEIGAATGESITLCWQNDLHMQYVRTHTGASAFELPNLGSRLPLFESISGLTALTLRRDIEIAQLAERLNAVARPGDAKVDLPAAMDQIRNFRTLGYGAGYDHLKPGIATLAWPLRHKRNTRAVVLAVVGPTERMRAETKNIVQIAKTAIKRFSGAAA